MTYEDIFWSTVMFTVIYLILFIWFTLDYLMLLMWYAL